MGSVLGPRVCCNILGLLGRCLRMVDDLSQI